LLTYPPCTRLEKSRAHRILWLLEELELEYEIKLYKRNQFSRAPEELKKIHPLGKSPIVELDYDNGQETKKLAESGHIINYLINHFDSKKKLTPKTEEESDEVDYFLHFSEGTIGSHLTYMAVHRAGANMAPFYVKPIINGFVDKIDSFYGVKEILLCANLLENSLKKSQAKKTSSSEEIFFVGEHLTGADIILFFNIHIFLESGRLDGAINKSDYPLLSKFLTQVRARPAFGRANEKIEILGNGDYKTDFSQ